MKGTTPSDRDLPLEQQTPITHHDFFSSAEASGRSSWLEKTDIRVMWFFGVFVILALIVTACGAGGQGRMTAVLWAMASLAVGMAVGFLFGIPRILQRGETVESSRKQHGEATYSVPSYRQQVNTNLTEISDWLTKIIVGLGLISLKELPGFILGKAKVLSASLQGTPPATDFVAFAVAVIVGFTVLGFLFGYLSTRLYLAGAFARADLDSTAQIRQRADATDGRVESLQEAMGTMRMLIKGPLIAGESHAPKLLAPASPDAQEMPSGTQGLPLEAHLLQLASDYNNFQSADKLERMRVRNELGGQMAMIINSDASYRDWATETALKNRNIGLVAGLAAAINAQPSVGDLKRLLETARDIPYKHARHVIVAALGRLFDSKLATSGDIPSSLALLSSYRQDADDSLQRRVRQTLAQISQSTGQNVSIGPA